MRKEKKYRLQVLEVTLLREQGSVSAAHYVVVLLQSELKKVLPIIIDYHVAYAIQIVLENKQPVRPLTHDLMTEVLKKFGIRVKEVVISDFKTSIFYATVICEMPEKNLELAFDSRASDAIALALRFNVPIYTYKSILDEAGLDMEPAEEVQEKPKSKSRAPIKPSIPSLENLSREDLKSLPDEMLRSLMEKAVEKEYFEIAAMIRDELQEREKMRKQTGKEGKTPDTE